MATFADKLREKSYNVRQKSIDHNNEVDKKILNYIHKFCDGSASYGRLSTQLYLSQVEREVGAGEGIWYEDTTLEARDDLTHIATLLEKEGLTVSFEKTYDEEDTLIKVNWSVWNDWKDGETHE